MGLSRFSAAAAADRKASAVIIKNRTTGSGLQHPVRSNPVGLLTLATAPELAGCRYTTFPASVVEHRKALAIHGSLTLPNALHCTVSRGQLKEQSRL
jgi:hypothetical protein